MKNYKSLLLLTVLLLACSKSSVEKAKSVSPEDFLVKDNEISGWSKAGTYWTAATAGDLSTYINGAAVIYTSRGFVEGAEQEYQGTILGGSVSVHVQIFDQGLPENADAVMEEVYKGLISPAEWVDGPWERAVIERLPLAQTILFQRARYYVKLDINDGSEEALNIIKAFANNVNGKFTEAGIE